MDMNSLWNVTAESLVKWAGLGDDGVDRPDSARLFGLKSQVCPVSRPDGKRPLFLSEVAAKYLPALVDLFRQKPEPISPVGMLINTISATPYFVRFLRSPAGNGIAAMQAKRIADSASEIIVMSVDDVGEIGQFLATLLLLQGIQDRKFEGRLASETAGRCLALLTADPRQDILESKLEKCGGPGCVRRVQKDGSELSQCGRCKTAVYCGVEHQKAAWAAHKPTCFAPTF
ncbi:hypothetical protein B0H16DRAFT_1538938 [Mycena metata]|uniref:MYND-type domain-containing protein n=1 Tax=Mycena metata TaxID=1033252 RepID=A0AAD7NDW4_9AGAR|nr:hypothetical protein B0H16DRAFT_1538938 [Mycena metata]